MNVLFLCCAYSEAQKSHFLDFSKRGYQFAAQNLQEALIDGFQQNGIELNVLSVPSLSSYLTGCRLLRVKDAHFIFRGKECGKSIGYINLPIIRRLNTCKINTYLEEWYKRCSGQKIIFVYALLKWEMQIACKFKQSHPDVKISIIIPDLPRFMGYNKVLKQLGFQKRDEILTNKLVKNFDAFVVLAEPMIKDLGVVDKKYIVVEGIYSDTGRKNNVTKTKNKVILYTGNIGERYGIRLLMDAFEKIQDENYRLWIRGTGDNSLVLEKAKNDDRIEYIGPMSKSELNSLQKKATVLVNPVTPDREFTRFFFPSKTMDYMASGTPTVMFKLDCLPAEYDEYLFFFRDSNAISMAETLKDICEKDPDDLELFGKRASSFIFNNKTPKKQVAKILELFQALF